MNKLFKKVKDINVSGCLSICFNTHRSRPECLKDAIALKNFVKEAEERLLAEVGKKDTKIIMENLSQLIETIDHDQNLDSMVIFANQDFAEYTRLALDVDNRVTVDNTFATRDLVRAMHENAGYYIMVLSRKQARLIEAFNDRFVREFSGDFPVKNDKQPTDKLESTMSQGQESLTEEFFNHLDKQVVKLLNENPKPLVIATEDRNFDHYRKIADKPDFILGHIGRKPDDEEVQHIIPDAWTLVKKVTQDRQQERLTELLTAVSSGKFFSDYNDIWSAINEGRGKTLFIKRGHFQPARITNNRIEIVNQTDVGVVDDIVDEMVEVQLAHGGDTVFIDGNQLDDFQGLALTTRY